MASTKPSRPPFRPSGPPSSVRTARCDGTNRTPLIRFQHKGLTPVSNLFLLSGETHVPKKGAGLALDLSGLALTLPSTPFFSRSGAKASDAKIHLCRPAPAQLSAERVTGDATGRARFVRDWTFKIPGGTKTLGLMIAMLPNHSNLLNLMVNEKRFRTGR